MTKRVLLCGLAGVLAASTLTGCGAKKKEEATVTEDGKKVVKVLSLGGFSWDAVMPEIEAEFEKQNPDVDIQIDFYPFGQLFELIEVKLGSGSSEYDVVTVDVPMVAAYTERGYLLPLDEYFSEEELAQFTETSVISGTWDGQFMAPPLETSAQLLFYNKDLLDQAGIQHPSTNPEERLTWEALEEMAKQTIAVVDAEGTQGISGILFEQVGRPYQILPLVNSKGAPSIGEDGLTVEGIVNSEGWVSAMAYYQGLFEQGIAKRGMEASETGNNFRSGKGVFHIGGTWNLNEAEAAGLTNVGYAPFPYFENGEVTTPTGSWHYGVVATSKNPAEAAEFVKYVTLGEGNDMWIEGSGGIPAKIESLEKILNDESLAEGEAGIVKIAAYEAANTAYPRPVTPGYNEYDTIIGATFEDIRNGAEIKGALDAAVQQLNSTLKKYSK